MKVAIIYNKDLTGVINKFGMQNKEKYNPEIVAYLEEMGYHIDKKSDYDFYFGAIHSVMRCVTKDGFQGAAEVRRDGTSGGF